jgi:hypothetical protein
MQISVKKLQEIRREFEVLKAGVQKGYSVVDYNADKYGEKINRVNKVLKALDGLILRASVEFDESVGVFEGFGIEWK